MQTKEEIHHRGTEEEEKGVNMKKEEKSKKEKKIGIMVLWGHRPICGPL